MLKIQGFPWAQQINSLVQQFHEYKFIEAEKIKSKLVSNYPDMIVYTLHREQFQDLSKLMDIGGTFLAASFDCERGFSLMNILKTKLQNRSEEFLHDMPM